MTPLVTGRAGEERHCLSHISSLHGSKLLKGGQEGEDIYVWGGYRRMDSVV